METFLTFFPFATRRRWQFSRQFPPCCSPSSPMILLPSIDFCKLKHATLHCAPHSPHCACRCTFTALHLEGRVSEVRVFLPTLLLFVPPSLPSSCSSPVSPLAFSILLHQSARSSVLRLRKTDGRRTTATAVSHHSMLRDFLDDIVPTQQTREI